MNIKIIGAILVIAGCGGFGFKLAATHLREESSLRQLISALDYMACELQYRLTPLPQLCRQAGQESKGIISYVFLALSEELEGQISPDAERCMSAALCRVKDLPGLSRNAIESLGHSLGRFDIEGQLKGLEAVRQECRRNLELLNQNRETRLRSYQTLGLCAGAAIAILFI